MEHNLNLKNFFIVFILCSLIFSLVIVDIADARGSSKKSSTAEKRAELKEATKEQVERSGSCISYCEIDHKVPLKCGGSNDASNLQSLPEKVHSEKTAREAKLCSDEHPELTCGGLKQETIEGFVVYLCVNAEPASSGSHSTLSSGSYSSQSSSKKSASLSSGDGRSTAGKCYVNGYTTKKGTRVSGYWRRC